jgi:hypothetical protein
MLLHIADQASLTRLTPQSLPVHLHQSICRCILRVSQYSGWVGLAPLLRVRAVLPPGETLLRLGPFTMVSNPATGSQSLQPRPAAELQMKRRQRLDKVCENAEYQGQCPQVVLLAGEGERAAAVAGINNGSQTNVRGVVLLSIESTAVWACCAAGLAPNASQGQRHDCASGTATVRLAGVPCYVSNAGSTRNYCSGTLRSGWKMNFPSS